MNTKAISKVHLLSVPLENDYKNTLYFDNKDSQESYFKSQIKHTFDNVSYQRKDFKFRCPKHIDELYNCNYVMYQNTYYNNRWFYGFIVNMTYISDGVTEIEIQTDVMQTWAFDYQVKASFVEREHVIDDTIGLHTYPEGLETGEYVVNDVTRNSELTESVVVMASTIDPSIQQEGDVWKAIGGSTGGGVYNGVRSGYKYYTFENKEESQLVNVLQAFASDGQMDAIGGMFMAPKVMIKVKEGDEYDNSMIEESMTPFVHTWGANGVDKPILKPTTINGHKVRNKKLFCFPYSYLLMSNNNGGNAIYKYELFNTSHDLTGECIFDIFGALTPSMDIIMYPFSYNGSNGSNYNEGLPCGKFPICGYHGDMYTNWITQNAVNYAVDTIGGSAKIATGIAITGLTGGMGGVVGGGLMASGFNSIVSRLGQMYEHSLVPVQAMGNVNTGNVSFAMNNTSYIAYDMSIRKEYAEIIDSYFDMFGYKVCKVKEPNKNHRSRYWYTKTQSVNISSSNIPNKDLQMIKDVYDNGVTFWKNADDVENYADANPII